MAQMCSCARRAFAHAIEAGEREISAVLERKRHGRACRSDWKLVVPGDDGLDLFAVARILSRHSRKE
jgi:hypothetical protein